jgi:hypothetical protein
MTLGRPWESKSCKEILDDINAAMEQIRENSPYPNYSSGIDMRRAELKQKPKAVDFFSHWIDEFQKEMSEKLAIPEEVLKMDFRKDYLSYGLKTREEVEIELDPGDKIAFGAIEKYGVPNFRSMTPDGEWFYPTTIGGEIKEISIDGKKFKQEPDGDYSVNVVCVDDREKYPHACKCGRPGYQGAYSFECSDPACTIRTLKE